MLYFGMVRVALWLHSCRCEPAVCQSLVFVYSTQDYTEEGGGGRRGCSVGFVEADAVEESEVSPVFI